MTIQETLELGKIHRDERSYEEAYKYFLEGAIAGDPEAIENLGLLYLIGEGVDQDDRKAFHYYRLYYDMTGKTDMLMNIAENIVEIKSREEGRRLYREFLEYLINSGEWEIYINKGFEYLQGDVFPKNVGKAISCFEQAIKKGVSAGYDCLGELYYLGEDVNPDYQKAYNYFQAYDGWQSFMKPFYLGEMYRLGLCVEKDIEKAEQQYRIIVDSSVLMKAVDRLYIQAVDRLREIEILKWG